MVAAGGQPPERAPKLGNARRPVRGINFYPNYPRACWKNCNLEMSIPIFSRRFLKALGPDVVDGVDDKITSWARLKGPKPPVELARAAAEQAVSIHRGGPPNPRSQMTIVGILWRSPLRLWPVPGLA